MRITASVYCSVVSQAPSHGRVSYRPEFGGAALAQVYGLPSDAFDALVIRILELVDQPWDATVAPPGDDP